MEKLYYDMERLATDESVPLNGYWANETEGEPRFPEPFADLQVVCVRPRDANIMVKGCFDHFVYLSFRGTRKRSNPGDPREIVLSWGERAPWAGSEVLWKEEGEKGRRASDFFL